MDDCLFYFGLRYFDCRLSILHHVCLCLLCVAHSFCGGRDGCGYICERTTKLDTHRWISDAAFGAGEVWCGTWFVEISFGVKRGYTQMERQVESLCHHRHSDVDCDGAGRCGFGHCVCGICSRSFSRWLGVLLSYHGWHGDYSCGACPAGEYLLALGFFGGDCRSYYLFLVAKQNDC